MIFSVVGPSYLEYILPTLALAPAIFFWGRGIRTSCVSDLIAGPAILGGICLLLFSLSRSSCVFSKMGELIAIFGIATVFLSFLASETSMLKRQEVRAIGVGLILLGLALMLVV